MRAIVAQRAVGTGILTLIGWQVGSLMGEGRDVQPRNALLGIALGGVLGFAAAPALIMWPYLALRRLVIRTPPADLLYALTGLILGLVVAALASYPLSFLPWWFGHVLPAVVAATCAYLGITLILMQRRELTVFLEHRVVGEPATPTAPTQQAYLLDTSAIIDGRIADITETGFLLGPLIVPRFVLIELQHIAGSSDDLRRARGRRGLEILNRMQKESGAVTISDLDAPDIPEVDGKLVKLARDLGCPVVTNDFNLNRVAGLQGVRVLNINQLANAIKPMVLPGEEMEVRIIQEGKELHQGVAYLDDGTMIVVENGRRHLHNEVAIVVTRVLQTVAGRMIFAQPKHNSRL